MEDKLMDKSLTATRFGKIYWSLLWRTTLLTLMMGMVVASLVVGNDSQADILDEPWVIMTVVILAVMIDWFVRYRVLAGVVWSDFQVGMLGKKGAPTPITAGITLAMTLVNMVVVMVFTSAFAWFANTMLANVDTETFNSIVPWLNAVQTCIGIWVEYLVLRWYMRYNLWSGGVLVLYELAGKTSRSKSSEKSK